MRIRLPIVAGRSCGECSACCTSLGVEEIYKPRDVRCPHLKDSGGCSIYDTRPESCRTYFCLWLAGVIEGDERRRPDKLGVIFDTGSTLPDVITCRECIPGALETEPVKYLIKKLSSKFIVYAMHLDGGRTPHGNPQRIRDIMASAEEVDLPEKSP